MPFGNRPNGCRSHSRDRRPKRVASSLKQLEQKLWRKDCLWNRVREVRMTDKNWVEAKNLELVVDLVVL